VRGKKRGRRFRRFRVDIVGGPAKGKSWAEPRDHCSLGSHPVNDVIVEDPTVSRFHCELSVADDVCRVRDLGSRNGTAVGAVMILDATVPSGALLTLGRTRLRVTLEDDRVAVPASAAEGFGNLVGVSPAMREVFVQLERAAASDATVLIEGETGTGKDGAAEALHAGGARAGGPFVVVDCGSIPAPLLESQLFGHEAGAFTDARERRIGAFEEASGGTLFLDEIGELAPTLQPKLLRALETRRVRRVGGPKEIDCDVRVIAATNRDLRADVNDGQFRADLYFRLAVIRIGMPPLRDRPEDLPLLVRQILGRLGADAEAVRQLTTPEWLDRLGRAAWPGNVRELRNHLERWLVLGEAEPLDLAARPAPRAVDAGRPYEAERHRALEAFERDYVRAALERAGGNVARAARDSGVNRGYLYRLINRYGLRS
jgi:DNA-binding NtrC family response regulator